MDPNNTQLVTADHLDLLVSAAVRYRVLVSETAATFSSLVGVGGTVGTTPDEAGRILLEENIASLHWRTSRGRGRVELDPTKSEYLHHPVDVFEPVEVLKASHAYQRITSDSPSWAGSVAFRLATAIAGAATQRLPGYAAARWFWERPPARTGEPVGLRRSWSPGGLEVNWVTREQMRRQWDDAALVLVAVDAIEDLPTGLAPRAGVYLLADAHVTAAQWPEIEQLNPDVMVMLPAGADWLAKQLRDPQRAVQRSHLAPVVAR